MYIYGTGRSNSVTCETMSSGLTFNWCPRRRENLGQKRGKRGPKFSKFNEKSQLIDLRRSMNPK